MLGLPWAFSRTLSVDIHGFNGVVPREGAIELIAMPAARGRDYSSLACPPNLGVAGMRFVGADLEVMSKTLASHAVAWASPPQRVTIAPYGARRAAAVLTPDGVWLEFLEAS